MSIEQLYNLKVEYVNNYTRLTGWFQLKKPWTKDELSGMIEEFQLSINDADSLRLWANLPSDNNDYFPGEIILNKGALSSGILTLTPIPD